MSGQAGGRIRGGILRLMLAVALAPSSLVGTAHAEAGGRLLYYLNCLGCHPQPAHDPGDFDSPGAALRPVGGFYQTEAGRRFFIRLPPAGSPPLSAEDEQLLRDEIFNWKSACFALTASTPLIRNRHVGRQP